MTQTNKRDLKIGIVGFGIGRLLAWSFRNIPRFYEDIIDDQVRLVGICTRHEASARAAMEDFNFNFCTTDYRELIDNKNIDIVCVAVPDYLHAPIVEYAIKARKSIYCEKPLSFALEEAKCLTDMAKGADITHQMGFQMRFGSAVKEAKKIIGDGLLGEVFTLRCTYQHSGYEDATRPISWRLDREKAGGGALFDLGSHAIDLVRFLLGDFKAITAKQETFIKRRAVSRGSSEYKEVKVDDVTFALCEMESGVIGSLEATRLATGKRVGPELTIHGSLGTINFNGYTDPHVLNLYLKTPKENIRESGFEKLVFEKGSPIPLEVSSLHSFLTNVLNEQVGSPSFEDGLRVQEILESVKLSASNHQWVNVNHI